MIIFTIIIYNYVNNYVLYRFELKYQNGMSDWITIIRLIVEHLYFLIKWK